MNRFHRLLLASFALFLSLPFPAPVLAQRAAAAHPRPARAADPLRGFDEYVATAMADWKVPGLAISVVKGDSMIFAKGYGVRRLGQSATVMPTPSSPSARPRRRSPAPRSGSWWTRAR